MSAEPRSTNEHLDRIEYAINSRMTTACEKARESLTAIREQIRNMEDWIRAAHGFAWAHERSCPRHDADEDICYRENCPLCALEKEEELSHPTDAELEQMADHLTANMPADQGDQVDRILAALKIVRDAGIASAGTGSPE